MHMKYKCSSPVLQPVLGKNNHAFTLGLMPARNDLLKSIYVLEDIVMLMLEHFKMN